MLHSQQQGGVWEACPARQNVQQCWDRPEHGLSGMWNVNRVCYQQQPSYRSQLPVLSLGSSKPHAPAAAQGLLVRLDQTITVLHTNLPGNLSYPNSGLSLCSLHSVLGSDTNALQ